MTFDPVSVKLLLVDDDTGLTTSLRRGLEAEGFVVDVSADGHDALWRLDEGTYGLIILDLMLPGRNGFLVCDELRRRGDWTPVLMLTAKDGDLDQAEALDTGADDYLTAVLLRCLAGPSARAAATRRDTVAVAPDSRRPVHQPDADDGRARGAARSN